MTNKRLLLVGAFGGMAAGMMMAAVEMVYGWASDAHTAWDAPMAIWAWVAGIEHFGQPANHVGPIMLGIGGHMMNSMIAGIVFVSLMRALRNPPGVFMLGTAYGVGLWALMRYVILPLNQGEDDLFTKSIVSPQWVWWLAHVALGMTAGLVYLVFGRRLIAETSTYPAAAPVDERQLQRTA